MKLGKDFLYGILMILMAVCLIFIMMHDGPQAYSVTGAGIGIVFGISFLKRAYRAKR